MAYPASALFHSASARAPALLPLQHAYASSGTTNGAWVQPSASRVSRTSSAPSASPCALAVPARFGEPLPIVVLQQMRVGLPLDRFALAMAASTASTSCPSTPAITFQP